MQKVQSDEKEKAERIKKKYVEEELEDRKKVKLTAFLIYNAVIHVL